MRLLAIESSSQTASAAIWEDYRVVAEYTVNHKMTHSQTLLPMIDEIVKRVGAVLQEFDAIGISKGPGSFTGLRIGSATAKGLGMSLGLPLVEVPTLEGLAYNFAGYSGLICPCMDARRKHVYGAVYIFENGRMEEVSATDLIEAQTYVSLVRRLSEEQGKKPVFLGDGVDVLREVLDKNDFAYVIATSNNSTHRAASVAEAAAVRYRAQMTVSAEEHVPDYLRPSQAEREMEKKE